MRADSTMTCLRCRGGAPVGKGAGECGEGGEAGEARGQHRTREAAH